jgi:Fe-S cluster assembly protein SufD
VNGKEAMINSRIHFFVGKESKLSVIERFQEKGDQLFINLVSEYVLDAGASVRVSSDQSKSSDSLFRSCSTRAILKRDSTFHSVFATRGSRYCKNDIKATLQGENCEANLEGVWSLDSNRQAHADIFIHHKSPHCRSRQLFKGVLQDNSRSSFQGKIYVDPIAQKTDAFQLNNNLLLSEKAHAETRPSLEIFADDVKASHGATVGQLDQDSLFYFMTRGICKGEAQKLLVEGFLQEVLQKMEVECAL